MKSTLLSAIPIFGLLGNDVPDAATGVGDVTDVAWNDMKMKLWHGLAGGGAGVETKVKGIRR